MVENNIVNSYFSKKNSMAKKTNTKKKKNKGNGQLMKFVLVVLFIAIISVLIAYFYTNREKFKLTETIENMMNSSSDTTVTTKKVKKQVKENPLKGTWVSNYDGTMLTIKGDTFTLEMPSVDASSKVKGSVLIEKTIATFINDANAVCPSVEGHYSFSFENDELIFSLIKDECDTRINRMSVSWFKI